MPVTTPAPPQPASAPKTSAPASPTPSAPKPSAAAIAAAKPPIDISTLAPTEPAKPPKPGSAKDRLFSSLGKKSGVEPETKPATQPSSEPTPEATSKAEAGELPSTDSPAQPAGKPETAPAAPAEKKDKPNPWKLYEAEKQARANAEKELQDTKARIVPEAERKAIEDRVAAAEKRAKELEDEIRFVRFEKSEEFQEKYQKPYDSAWKRATAELSQISIEDPSTSETRPATAADLLQLVNMPLGQAREAADQLFGKFANEVMAYRKEIRSLFDSQQAALEEARTKGAERENQRTESAKRTHEAIRTQITTAWKQANEAATAHEKHGQFFKHREGDEDWNKRLDEGYALIDKALAENPMNPELTPEQRIEIVQRQAAMRNRAASWAALRYENARLQEKIESLEKSLKEHAESVPPAGGGSRPSATPGGPQKAKDRLYSNLDKIAKPA